MFYLWEEGMGTNKFLEENQDLENGVGEEYKVLGN